MLHQAMASVTFFLEDNGQRVIGPAVIERRRLRDRWTIPGNTLRTPTGTYEVIRSIGLKADDLHVLVKRTDKDPTTLMVAPGQNLKMQDIEML